jgi:serine/threonine protein kinase
MDPKDSQDPSRQTSLPSQIGSYQILERIASGGMGEVFLAFDPFCKRKIALKKIRSDLMTLTSSLSTASTTTKMIFTILCHWSKGKRSKKF